MTVRRFFAASRRAATAQIILLSATLQLGCLADEPIKTAAAVNSFKHAGQKASASSTQSKAESTFASLVDRYFEAGFKDSPNSATEIGIHDYDTKINLHAEADINKRIAEQKQFRAEFEKIIPSSLSKPTRLDREMLIANINSELLELESIQNWKHNPDSYSSGISSAIFSLMKRNFASPDDRLRSVIAREKLVPQLFANARVNLKESPKIDTEVALEQLPGIISFFETAVPEAFSAAKDPALKAEFKESNAKTIAELKDYQKFLKDVVLPKSVEKFAIGKDNYEKKLLYDEMVSEPLDSLLTKGYGELHRLQKEFVETAHKVDPTKDPREVYAELSSDHPKPEELISSVSNVLANLREKSQSVVTIPGTDVLTVQETPPFMRATTFASMDAPGPFEKVAKEAYYQVTLPEKDWSAQKTEEHMRFFCRQDLLNTSVHEAYPGHFVQGLWQKNAASKTRKLLSCGTYSEGWAHYCEQMMVDEGLVGKDDPKVRLVQIHDALLRACRYIVGIQMHTKGMTMAQAKEFFVKEGFQEPANGDREAKRGTMDPTYLVYTLGKLQILSLRDDYKKAKGSSYTLKDFHDKFLAEGCPPIKIVREALLSKD